MKLVKHIHKKKPRRYGNPKPDFGKCAYHGETGLHEEDQVGGEKHEGCIHGTRNACLALFKLSYLCVVVLREGTALGAIVVVGAEDSSCGRKIRIRESQN